MKTKRWAMLAGVMMLAGLVLLVTRAAAEDVGETCLNVSDNVAVAACTRAIRSSGHNAPRPAVLYANRCAAHINRGEADEALSDCNQAIQLDPKNATAFHNRAAGYSAKGSYDRAIADLDQAIQLDPNNAISYSGRCAARIKKGEIDQALGDCNQAIRLDPKNGIALQNRAAGYFAKGDYDRD